MSNMQIDWVLDFQLGDVNVGLQADHRGDLLRPAFCGGGARRTAAAAKHIAEQGVQK